MIIEFEESSDLAKFIEWYVQRMEDDQNWEEASGDFMPLIAHEFLEYALTPEQKERLDVAERRRHGRFMALEARGHDGRPLTEADMQRLDQVRANLGWFWRQKGYGRPGRAG